MNDSVIWRRESTLFQDETNVTVHLSKMGRNAPKFPECDEIFKNFQNVANICVSNRLNLNLWPSLKMEKKNIFPKFQETVIHCRKHEKLEVLY